MTPYHRTIDRTGERYDDAPSDNRPPEHLIRYHAATVAKFITRTSGGVGVMLADGSRTWTSCTQAARDMATDPTSVRRSAESNGRTTAKGYTFLFTCPKARARAVRESRGIGMER